MHLLVEDVPTDQKIFSSFVSTNITPDGKYMWKFQPFHGDNGSTQIHGSNFTESFFPVIGAYPVRSSMAVSD